MAMQRDENEDRLHTNAANRDENDLVQNIEMGIVEGDLSPKQSRKLKNVHDK